MRRIVDIRTIRGGPARQLTSELDTNDLRSLQLPGQIGHDVDGIGTTNTNGAHTQTTSVGGVGVGTDQETTGESIVLEKDLVDNTRAGSPETNVVLGACGGKEVINLLVDRDSAGKILRATNLGLDQVIAVNGGGVGDGGHAGGHELEDGHLSGGILASDTIRAQLQVGLSTLNLLTMRVIQVRIDDLLGEGKWSVKTATNDGEVLCKFPRIGQYSMLEISPQLLCIQAA